MERSNSSMTRTVWIGFKLSWKKANMSGNIFFPRGADAFPILIDQHLAMIRWLLSWFLQLTKAFHRETHWFLIKRSFTIIQFFVLWSTSRMSHYDYKNNYSTKNQNWIRIPIFFHRDSSFFTLRKNTLIFLTFLFSFLSQWVLIITRVNSISILSEKMT